MKTKTSGLLSIFFIICIIQSCTNNNASKKISDSNGYINLNSGACYFDDIDSIEKKTRIKIDTPSKREVQEIKDIMAYAGLPQNFTVYRGDISNAMATTIGNQRLIVYNKDLFTRMDGSDSSYWSSLFILAHEIGHHLAYNMSASNSAFAKLEVSEIL